MRFWAAILAGAALAGATVTSAAAAEEPKPAARAEAGQPSARQVSLSRRYVELMQGDQLQGVIGQLILAEANSSDDARGLSQEDRDFMIELTTEMTAEMIPAMMAELVPIYARTFTEAELEGLIAFYDTELGRSIIAKTWTSMPATNEAMMSVMPQMLEKMGAKMCARYGCDPSELDELSGAVVAPARTK